MLDSATEMIFNKDQKVFRNRTGLRILDKPDRISDELDAYKRELEKVRNVNNSVIRGWMTLREPIFAITCGHAMDQTSRYDRNAVAHGGSVELDITIICFRQEDGLPCTSWLEGFEKIYNIAYHYVSDLPNSSKMVDILNMYADVSLQTVFFNRPHTKKISRMCTSIIDMWKSAYESGLDPNEIFNKPEVLRACDTIANLFNQE